MTYHKLSDGPFLGGDFGSDLVVPAQGDGPAACSVPSSGGINLVRFKLKPMGDGKFQIHYTQTTLQAN
jgi:hypothetical protein